ncbi:MAG: lipopolysaccharide biosynthesis protein [Flavobacteriales bacterium]|nr:lipopolysaccharide biosynthesis protein [Flavobacteriales bacterium]
MMKRVTHIIPARFQAYVDQGLISGVSFLLTIILARLLGVEGFGVFSFIYLVLLFMSSIHQALIIKPMMTSFDEQGEDYELELKFMNSIVVSVLAIVSVIFLLLTSQLSDDYNLSVIDCLSAGAFIFSFLQFDFTRKLSYTKDQINLALPKSLLFVLMLPLTLGLSYLFLEPNITNVLCSIAVAYLLKAGIKLRKLSVATKVFSHHWQEGKWLLATSILQWTSGNYYLVMAAGVLGPAALGVFRIVQSLVGLLNVLMLILENVLPRQLSKVENSFSFLELTQLVWGKIKGPFLLLSGAVFVLSIGAETLMNVVYGENYDQSNTLILPLALMYFLVFAGTVFAIISRVIKTTKYTFLIYILNTVLALVLARPLVNSFGLLGVIIGLYTSQILCILIYAITTYKALQNQAVNTQIKTEPGLIKK